MRLLLRMLLPLIWPMPTVGSQVGASERERERETREGGEAIASERESSERKKGKEKTQNAVFTDRLICSLPLFDLALSPPLWIPFYSC